MKFRITSLFLLTLLVASCLAVYVNDGSNLVVTVLFSNFFAAAVAIFITKVLRFPTDGGYRDQAIREEFVQVIVEKPVPKKMSQN
ncbi:MAG: hypothetical protein AB8B55_06610 [Mariniblastus sp.]